jgi:tetratricopeptide (TPR) repeat protein
MKNIAHALFCLAIILSYCANAAEHKPLETRYKSSHDSYDSIIARGNNALTEGKYRLAKLFFKQALELRPSDRAYPVYQIHVADSLLAIRAKQDAPGIQQRFQTAMKAWDDYDKAATISNYQDELFYLKRFLNFIPDSSELSGGYHPARKITDAIDKIEKIRKYLTQKNGIFYQSEAIPYTDLELNKKFPDVDFASALNQSTLDTANSNVIITASKKLLVENPRLSLSDSAANIKLTCQSISVNDNYAYFKFCIRNYDSLDFVAGNMLLSVIKKDKSVQPVHPVYISDFPIVLLPKKEFFIIYVTKAPKINNGDALSFQMSDLNQNKKMRINVPAALVNQGKNL